MADHRFTKAQHDVLRAIADGMIIQRDGHGFSLHDENGRWIGKASVAVKSLAQQFLVAKADDRIFFTTRGYSMFYGGLPVGENARRCALADERVDYVKSMMASNEAQS